MTMPLAEYIASEQAREEVARMVAAPPGIIKAHRIDGGFLARGWKDAGVWSQIGVIRGDFERSVIVSAYYLNDGDRYVVTDLGEGVRALRLRGASIQRLGDAISEVLGAMWVANQLPPRYGITGMVNGEIAPMSSITAADLPDAICRVMLASLRVAGWGCEA